MEGIYTWVKNIVFYLIFLTVLMGLLPSGKYEKYIRFFAGMVLIMAALSPFLSGLRLEDQVAGYFEEFSFRNEAEDFKKEVYGMEEKRMEQLISQYEEAVEMDVKAMAEDAGLTVKETAVRIGADPSGEDFGKVTFIHVTAAGMQGADGEKAAVLRRKAAGYYQLEERYVEIQFQNEQGQVASGTGGRDLPDDPGAAFRQPGHTEDPGS